MRHGDNFEKRSSKLKKLSDEELKERFWKLTEEIVDPLIDLAQSHTSPSIERSVLLRMGFNSLDAKAIVSQILEAGLLSKGAGHVILKLAEAKEVDYKKAGELIKNKDVNDEEMRSLFLGGDNIGS
ncbi:MAG: ornithine aminomutase subunit alpha [Bacillota bacterium]